MGGTISDDGWQVAAPDTAAMNARVLSGLAPQFEAWKEANLHAALMVRHGKIAYEKYFSGEDRAWGTRLGRVDFNAGVKHDVRSINKSIVSLTFGVACDRGLIRDLDASVFDYFPEHADLRTPEKALITVRHVLTMSAGLAWNEYISYGDPANSERRMMDAPDVVRFVLEQPVARRAGAAYNYSGGCTALLSAILQKTSGQPIHELASNLLFEPLGIKEIDWGFYTDGRPNISSLRMRPRDLAKIGQLVLNKGKWNDRQIVSQAWIDDATSPHVHGEGLFFYGYQWWLGRSLVNRQEFKWISAVGLGGQRLYIVPSLDLVVVVMAGLYDNYELQPIIGEVVMRRYAIPAALAA